MIDRTISKIGVGVALLFMVCELSYINAKSLMYLDDEPGIADHLFSVVGAMAFSMVTVLVMRKSREQWVKLVFPVFDTLLVFGGFNLRYAADIVEGTDNPIRFGLTVFMAVFTGLITYSLGLINYADHVAEPEMQRNSEEVEGALSALEQQNEELRERNEKLRVRIKATEAQANRFLKNHLLYEAWIARKKSKSTLTSYDVKIEALANRIRQGETITIQEVTPEPILTVDVSPFGEAITIQEVTL